MLRRHQNHVIAATWQARGRKQILISRNMLKPHISYSILILASMYMHNVSRTE